MHWVRLITFLGAPLLLTLAAPALVLWAWSNDLPLLPALLVGLVFTSLALAIHLVGQALPRHDEDLHLLWEEVEHLRAAILHADEHEAEPAAQAPRSEMHPQEGGQPARQQEFATSHVGTAPPPRQEAGAPHAARQAAPGGSPITSPARDMRLYMEPVVALQGNATVFYRALPALPADAGRIYLGDQAFLRARQQGWMADFTRQVLQRSVHFARQLNERGVAAAVACPLNMMVLEDGNAVSQALLRELESGEARVPLMFILRREYLTRASQGARMQMLMLAQASDGVVLDMAAPDINAFFLPAPLPVRYLDIPVDRLAQADPQALMQRLGARGWTLVASGIDSPEWLVRARALASLGRGRHLSPPRRVRDAQHEAAATNGGQTAHMPQAAMG